MQDIDHKNRESEVLNSIYRGASTASRAISDLKPKSGDPQFLEELKAQEEKYQEIAVAAENSIGGMGLKPKPVHPVQKAEMKMGVDLNTAFHSDTGHLAELMIKGTDMGIIRMTKVLNDSYGVSEQTANLAQRLITTEQQHIDRLKTYLH